MKYKKINSPQISENGLPKENLPSKKSGKVPVLHLVNDKSKNHHLLHETNL